MAPSGKSILKIFGLSGAIDPVQMDQDDYQLIQFGGEVVDQTFTLNFGFGGMLDCCCFFI